MRKISLILAGLVIIAGVSLLAVSQLNDNGTFSLVSFDDRDELEKRLAAARCDLSDLAGTECPGGTGDISRIGKELSEERAARIKKNTPLPIPRLTPAERLQDNRRW